jgi:hypothetical protein
MKLRSSGLALFVILMLAQSTAQVANSQTTQTTTKPTTYVTPFNLRYEISNLADETTIRVDLLFQPCLKAVVPTLADVAIDERHDQSIKDLFAVEMERPQDPKAIPAMLIRVKPRSLQQGTYKLRIEVRPDTTEAKDQNKAPAKSATSKSVKAPAAKPAQSLSLEVKVPAVTIKTTQNLIIHQVRNGIFGGDDPPTLALTGASPNARLTDVKIHQIYLSGSDNVSTSRRVDFGEVKEITPDSTSRSPITLSGNFPLGTSTGAALISAPQLEKPIDLTFEVHNRRAKWIIVVTMILGVILGFVARVWTRFRIELRQARLKALDAATTLERELQNRPDAEFHEAVEPAFTSLTTAIENGSAAQLTNQITAANAALVAALNDLDQRRITVKSQFETLSGLAKKSSLLPAEISAAVSIVGAELEKAQSQLELDNVAAAAQTLQPLAPGLGSKLGPAASNWRSHVSSLLEVAEGISAFLPAKVGAGIDTDNTTVKTKLAELVPTTEASSLTEISSLFDAIRNVRDSLTVFVRRLATQLANSVNALKIQFDKPLPESVAQLFNEAEQISKRLPELAEHPEAGAKELQERLAALTLHWSETMLAQIQGDNTVLVTSSREDVETLLDQNQYFDATLAVIEFLQAQADMLLGSVAVTNVVPSFEEAVSFLDLLGGGGRPETSVTMVTTVHERTIPPNLTALRTRTWKELAVARALQFAIAGVIIMAVGYALFAEEFVGTFKELMAVFVWAFGLNLSADSMMETITSTKLS